MPVLVPSQPFLGTQSSQPHPAPAPNHTGSAAGQSTQPGGQAPKSAVQPPCLPAGLSREGRRAVAEETPPCPELRVWSRPPRILPGLRALRQREMQHKTFLLGSCPWGQARHARAALPHGSTTAECRHGTEPENHFSWKSPPRSPSPTFDPMPQCQSAMSACFLSTTIDGGSTTALGSVPILSHSCSEEIFPNIQLNLPWLNLRPVPLVLSIPDPSSGTAGMRCWALGAPGLQTGSQKSCCHSSTKPRFNHPAQARGKLTDWCLRERCWAALMPSYGASKLCLNINTECKI